MPYGERKDGSDKVMPQALDWIKIGIPTCGELIRTDIEENGLLDLEFQGIDLKDSITGETYGVRYHELETVIHEDWWLRTKKGKGKKFSEYAWYLKNNKPDYFFYFWVQDGEIVAAYFIDVPKFIKILRADKTRQYIKGHRWMKKPKNTDMADDGGHCIHFYYDDAYSIELFNKVRKEKNERQLEPVRSL
jgi:hypothetical protein